MIIREACVETLEEAINAERQGADRLELCTDLDQDGLTPSFELIGEVMEKVQIPVMVMIRPRGGDFVYSPGELELMKSQILMCKELGAWGVVLGLLDEDGRVDVPNTELLAKLANPLEVTFHKAIDVTHDLLIEAQRVSQIPGITRILTSGGRATALQGKEIINQVVKLIGSKAKILAAGRITDENWEQVAQELDVDEFHGRRIVGSWSRGGR